MSPCYTWVISYQREALSRAQTSLECTWQDGRVRWARQQQQVDRETACRASTRRDTTTDDDLLCASSQRALAELCPTSPDPSRASRPGPVSEATVALPPVSALCQRPSQAYIPTWLVPEAIPSMHHIVTSSKMIIRVLTRCSIHHYSQRPSSCLCNCYFQSSPSFISPLVLCRPQIMSSCLSNSHLIASISLFPVAFLIMF